MTSLLVTGLPASGKELAVESALELGYSFGDPDRLKPSYEHPAALTWFLRIATSMGRHPNMAYTAYNPDRHTAAVREAQATLPPSLPEALKCIVPGIVPVLLDVLPIQIVVWCQRALPDWTAYLRSINYQDWRGMTAEQAQAIDNAALTVCLSKVQIIVLDLYERQFHSMHRDLETGFNAALTAVDERAKVGLHG